jgi:hypothetical protein
MTDTDSNTITYLITGLLILLPFGLLWYLLFRLIKKYLKTFLSYSFLTFCTNIALMAYCGLSVAIFANIGGQFGGLAMAVSYAITLTSTILILPTLIITIVLFIVYLVGNKNKADT